MSKHKCSLIHYYKSIDLHLIYRKGANQEQNCERTAFLVH